MLIKNNILNKSNNDTREKLEADASKLLAKARDDAWAGIDCEYSNEYFNEAVKLLDRQAAITKRDCAECAEGMGEYADGLCDPLKERIADLQAKADTLDALVRCLENDHGLCASWDGLRKFWNIEVTHERFDARAALSASFDRACAYIADMCGTCPGDAKDYDRDCESECSADDMDAECWRHYFEHAKPDTLESLLKEFGTWYKYVSGGCDEPGIIADYAEQIRKAVGNG